LSISIVKIGTVAEKSSNAAFSTGVRYVTVRVNGIPKAVRWLFLLFVFSFPFEATDLGFMTGSLSISKLGGLFFFIFYFFYYGPFSKKRTLPHFSEPMSWFLGYLIIFVLNVFFVDEQFLGGFFSRCFTLTQLMVFFWVASDLLKDKKMAMAVLLTYSIASVLLALASIFQVPGFYEVVAEGRVTAIGDNPNALAEHMSVAGVTLVGLCLHMPYRFFLRRIFLLLLALPLMTVMVQTGSRTGVLAFIIGCLIYLLPHWRSRRLMISIILATLVIGATVYMVANDPDLMRRWNATYYEGSTSGRDVIYEAAFNMISEKPILGWHPIMWFYELGYRVGLWTGRDAHNLVLALLLEVGVVGTIPFLVGLWLCGRSAWRARVGHLGLLPLALLFTVLAAGTSGTTLVWKPQWLVLALSLATASTMTRELGTKFQVHLVRRPQ
jgi:O-antigen ligase